MYYSTLDVSRTASYEITLARLSACPSVTKFSQDWIISFFWYFTLRYQGIIIKWFGGPNLGPTGIHRFQNEVFAIFLSLDYNFFLEIPYIDSLRQCLTSSKGKTHEKILGASWLKLGSKLGFFSFYQVWFISFPVNCIGW